MYSERIGHDKWPGCCKRDEMLARKSAKYVKKYYPDSDGSIAKQRIEFEVGGEMLWI